MLFITHSVQLFLITVFQNIPFNVMPGIEAEEIPLEVSPLSGHEHLKTGLETADSNTPTGEAESDVCLKSNYFSFFFIFGRTKYIAKNVMFLLFFNLSHKTYM